MPAVPQASVAAVVAAPEAAGRSPASVALEAVAAGPAAVAVEPVAPAAPDLAAPPPEVPLAAQLAAAVPVATSMFVAVRRFASVALAAAGFAADRARLELVVAPRPVVAVVTESSVAGQRHAAPAAVGVRLAFGLAVQQAGRPAGPGPAWSVRPRADPPAVCANPATVGARSGRRAPPVLTGRQFAARAPAQRQYSLVAWFVPEQRHADPIFAASDFERDRLFAQLALSARDPD